MRKRFISPVQPETAAIDQEWLNLEALAEVEITSEDVDHPIEAAFHPDQAGWRASVSGKQIIRLHFDRVQTIKRIRIEFVEPTTQRTQEFVISWAPEDEKSYREIIRQQWNFSPDSATHEVEDIHVELTGVKLIELIITPDINSAFSFASLARLQIGK